MKTYCFKLYNSKRNKKLHSQINIAANIYNHCIALHKRYYRMYGKSLNIYKLQKHITKLKKLLKYGHWNDLGSQAIQDITDRIDRGYKLFFHNKEHKIRSAPPGFKKTKKYRSFTLKQAGYKFLAGNKILVGKQIYKYHKSRDIEGEVKTVTIKRDAVGDMYICIVCKQEQNQVLARTGEMVGYDFGLKRFLTASDGKDYVSPLFFSQNTKSIKQANRKLSRKQKGSNNRKRARLELARLHKRVANQRKDYHFKLARELCGNYALVAIEDLNIKSMQRLWGRKISDLGHSSFVKILKYQGAKCGTTVVEIPRFYPSSKTCSECGYILETLSLSSREWTCPVCATVHDRDRNASVNVLRVGASTFFGEIAEDLPRQAAIV